MTGIPIRDSSDGIWDDGEWISWEWINSKIGIQEQDADEYLDEEADNYTFPCPQPSGLELRRLVSKAIEDERITSTTSEHWGLIGELYAAELFNIKLTRGNSQGHDGRLGDDLVEIKTITPRKKIPFVRVKRSGNFSMLAIVRVRTDYSFEATLVRRDRLPEGNGGSCLVLSWKRACALAISS